MSSPASPGVPPAPADDLREVLARGIEAAIITRDQAERLAALAAGPGDPVDDECLRFVTGFADIFVTFGVLLFLGSAGYLAAAVSGPGWGDGLVAALAWGLAELFTRRRRMALPSIVLLIIFAVKGFLAAAIAIGGSAALSMAVQQEPATISGAAVITFGLVALHYRRFGVPITVAAGTGALVAALVFLGVSLAPEQVLARLDVILACAGLAVFALAMRFDLSDPARLTRRSDIAFWLHLLAAPLMVHPVLSRLVVGQSDVDATVSHALASGAQASVLGVVLFLSLVALVTDRRAILVSGLAYAGYTIGDLIRRIGLESTALPLSLLVLGAFILLLSAGWRPLRRAVLRPLPPGIRERLPHPSGL